MLSQLTIVINKVLFQYSEINIHKSNTSGFKTYLGKGITLIIINLDIVTFKWQFSYQKMWYTTTKNDGTDVHISHHK